MNQSSYYAPSAYQGVRQAKYNDETNITPSYYAYYTTFYPQNNVVQISGTHRFLKSFSHFPCLPSS